MKSIANILNTLIPALIVLVGYMYGGPILGTAVFALVIFYLIYKRIPDIYMLRASRALKKGEVDKAFALMEKSLGTGRMPYNYKLYYAYAALRYGRTKKSERLFNMVLNAPASEQQKLDAKCSYSMFLWKTGRLDEAIEMLEDVYEKMKNTAVYGRLGFFYIEKAQKSDGAGMDKAVSFNEEAYDYNSDDPSICDNMALCHLYKGEADKALEIYEALMEKEIKFPVIYYNYALALEAAGKTEKAVSMLEKALTFKFSALAAVGLETVEAKLGELKQKLEKKQAGA